MRHYKIEIRVAYDDAMYLPEDMANQLLQNVESCIARCGLLDDSELETVVDVYKATVEAYE